MEEAHDLRLSSSCPGAEEGEMTQTRGRIAALAAAGALTVTVVSVSAGATGGNNWSRAQCQRAFISWFHQHPKATQPQQKAYMRSLNAQHGCSFRYA